MGTTRVHQKLDIEAVLRPSRWASGMQVIGAIPAHIAGQLGLSPTARSVWLHEQTVAHITDQRNLTIADSEFVFEYMPAAVLHPMFCGREYKGDALRISLAEYVRSERRYLYLSATVVGAGDRDEVWVSSGYPMCEETLRRYLRCGRLQGVIAGGLEGGKTRTARRFQLGAATQMP